MKNSPFIYGNTVSSKAFTDREIESKKLYQNLTNGINTSIISPRRWGKSSLVEKVIVDINQNSAQHKTVLIDLFSVGSEEEFLEIFACEVIKSTSTKLEDWLHNVKEFFKIVIPQITIGMDPQRDFKLSFDWRELKKHSSEILNLPELIGTKKTIKIVVCLDEFQNLATFANYEIFEKKMRSVWQRQKNVTYCLFGSKRHLMSDIFNNPSKPFYRFGDIMFLSKIDSDKWVNFIVQGFKETSKDINEEAASLIPQIMKNHSWYVQQLSHYTWNLTDKIAGVDEVEKALDELIQANMPLYQKNIEILSGTQVNLLKAIEAGERQFTSTIVMNKYRLGTPRNVSKNKAKLINDDVIQEANKLIEFVDPAFELWFRKFMG